MSIATYLQVELLYKRSCVEWIRAEMKTNPNAEPNAFIPLVVMLVITCETYVVYEQYDQVVRAVGQNGGSSMWRVF